MSGRADGHGRVYQAAGDLHVTEHHHAAPDWSGPDSVRRPAVGRTPLVLRDRTELMNRLEAAVGPGQADTVHVLHGLGGAGKTAVAHTLFRRAAENAGRLCLWVNASGAAGLRSGMLAVAADRGAREGELIAARSGLRAGADLAWDLLDRSDRPWLLVLDNADDPAVLQEGGWLRSSPSGVVLVTTRQAAGRWWPEAELLHVGVLPRADAARVLHDLAPEAGSVEEAERIADRLGRLPLALTLAGGFLANQVLDPWTMADYERSLDDGQGLAALYEGTDPDTGDDRLLLGTTWQLSLDALTARGLPEATTLLQLLACWGSDPLPVQLLAGPAPIPGLPRTRVEPALRGLLDHSLTHLGRDGIRCLRTHGIVLDSVARRTPSDRHGELLAAAVARLDGAVPPQPTRGPRDPYLGLLAPHCTALLRHTTDPAVTVHALAVTVRLATALHRTGEYLTAHELARTCADLAESRLGAEHDAALTARTREGRSLFRLGRFTDAAALHRRVLGVRERLLGPDHPDTLESAFALQFPLLQLEGHHAEAHALLARVAEGRERILGPAHPLTLYTRANQLEYLEGDELRREVDRDLPADCLHHLGADHPVTVVGRHNHAYALWQLGDRAEEADRLAAAVLADYLRLYGPRFPVTVSAQLLHARTRAATGHLPEAVDLMAEVVTGREETLGPDHPYTVRTREILAELRAELRAESDGRTTP
ncbi:tetratricopeptide repeat protein [Kitasatospora sp. NBC_01539]|uniref:tetratricopeptide repeat protein n=1 Tax=Kitasatospora sp. NBC_01539 TaxID=2903577 RepID=UPI00386012C6